MVNTAPASINASIGTKEKKPLSFHTADLYDSIKIPVRDFLLELTGYDIELAVLLNQIIFSNKEKLTLNDIKTLSLNEKTKQTLRKKLDTLVGLGLIKKHKANGTIFNQDVYEPMDIILPNQEILALIEGRDLRYNYHYLTAALINKFRQYALSGINQVHISVRQLKNMLGIECAENTVRNALKQLIKDDYLSEQLVYGVYNYTINVAKITENYTSSDITKFAEEIFYIYSEYLNKTNTVFDDDVLKSYKTTLKRMINDGYNPDILKHIFTFILVNHKDYSEIVTPIEIKKSYDKLYKLSKALSRRKAKSFIYKLKNNLLEEKVLSDSELWAKAMALVEESKPLLQKWYYHSLAGVTDVDFNDFYQEALRVAFEYFKKNKNDKFKISSIKFRLQDFMYKKRNKTDSKDNGINTIINFDNYLYDININNFAKEEIQEVVINDDGIKELLKGLDERSKFIIRNYFGLTGKSLTFKEIGSKLGLTESIIARTFKKAMLYLKDSLPPNKEKYFRNLIYKTDTI